VGEALSLKLAATEATRLHLVGRNSENLDRVARECASLRKDAKAISWSTCDLRSESDVDRMWSEFEEAHGPNLDVLVANAGISRPGLVEEYSVAQYDDVMDTNVKGVFLALRKAIPSMRAQGSGQIVVTNSVRGVRPGASAGLYTASKFAVRGLVLSARLELRPHGIKVGSVLPGGIATPWWEDEARGGREAGSVSTDAFLTADEVADAMLMLIDQAPGSDIEELIIEPGGVRLTQS